MDGDGEIVKVSYESIEEAQDHEIEGNNFGNKTVNDTLNTLDDLFKNNTETGADSTDVANINREELQVSTLFYNVLETSFKFLVLEAKTNI